MIIIIIIVIIIIIIIIAFLLLFCCFISSNLKTYYSCGGTGNALFSKGEFSLCLNDSLLLCCNASDLDSAAPGVAVTNKGLPRGDLKVEAFRGHFQGDHEATFAVERRLRLSIPCN